MASKPSIQEFLTLHYFALDSADWWEKILGDFLPDVQFPGAVVRRTRAWKIFEKNHVAPSDRRCPHPVWNDSFCLLVDLLLGSGMGRYVGTLQQPAFTQRVSLRGFSAGSYAGLALLHILWPFQKVVTDGRLGAIACPPDLLSMEQAKSDDRLHLIHYEKDELCNWKPGQERLKQSSSTHTYVMSGGSAYKGHFGPSEHGYAHWLGLSLPHGKVPLSTLLFWIPDAASKNKRDATPLRLISWLSYKLRPEVDQFIEEARLHLSTWKESEGGKVLRMGKRLMQEGDPTDSETALRDRLIDLVSIGNLRHKPEALFALFRQFMTRISLPGPFL